MPGVLQVEAMGQVAELALRGKLTPGDNGEIYIKALRKVKFRKPNFPGDRIIIEVEVKKVEGNDAEVTASTKNASGVTCQATLIMSVRERAVPESMPVEFNQYDKTADIVMDTTKIMSVIPHRYPFLLIDYIHSVIDNRKVVAVKNISQNEPLLRGYTPGHATLPSSLQPEIVAQTGCVYALSKPEHKGKIAYFMSIESAEFYHPAMPGDQLICEVDLPDFKGRFGKGDGFIRVGDKIISRTNLMFAIIEPTEAQA
jgi:3-hydroxyacyl-[acyl-carrier-protein] dehydratase